jgi:predicted pyridoxine 5'-phosphate oxidase superfamily flavin-nucleotide-binding protein
MAALTTTVGLIGALAHGPEPAKSRVLPSTCSLGNKQYIRIGNLAENERSFLFLMDYAKARRLNSGAAQE